MATASKIGVGSGRLQKFGSTSISIAIPSQNFDSTLANPFDFTSCRRKRRSGVAMQHVSAHFEILRKERLIVFYSWFQGLLFFRAVLG